MKTNILIICFVATINIFSQDITFVENNSLQNKIKNVLLFIEKSPTININYTSDKIFIKTNGRNFSTFILETNINKKFSENRCVKINEKVTWIIDDINDVDDEFIDKEQLKKISDCSCVVKKEKSKEMLNSVFNFYQDMDGDLFLYSLVTFDRLLYLDIEFREYTNDEDDE